MSQSEYFVITDPLTEKLILMKKKYNFLNFEDVALDIRVNINRYQNILLTLHDMYGKTLEEMDTLLERIFKIYRLYRNPKKIVPLDVRSKDVYRKSTIESITLERSITFKRNDDDGAFYYYFKKMNKMIDPLSPTNLVKLMETFLEHRKTFSKINNYKIRYNYYFTFTGDKNYFRDYRLFTIGGYLTKSIFIMLKHKFDFLSKEFEIDFNNVFDNTDVYQYPIINGSIRDARILDDGKYNDIFNNGSVYEKNFEDFINLDRTNTDFAELDYIIFYELMDSEEREQYALNALQTAFNIDAISDVIDTSNTFDDEENELYSAIDIEASLLTDASLLLL